MCCNGVMFHTVRLQSSDSAQELKALGIRIQYKKKGSFFNQPCSAFKENACSIYAQRPSRCRLFECQQLTRLTADEITETEALEKIQELHRKVDCFQQLIDQSGGANSKKPINKQYEKIIAEPLDTSADPKLLRTRAELTQTFHDLNEFLNQHFRKEKITSN